MDEISKNNLSSSLQRQRILIYVISLFTFTAEEEGKHFRWFEVKWG